MTSSVSNSYETEKKYSAIADILGFEGSEEISYDQDSSVTNSIQQGLEFYWFMAMPDGNESGYQTVVVEPQIVIPIPGKCAGPWTPPNYSVYQPWLITYDIVSAEMTPGTPLEQRQQKLVTGVNPFLGGTITTTPSSPKKGDQVKFIAIPAPGYSFAYWKAWGVTLDDLRSPRQSVP